MSFRWNNVDLLIPNKNKSIKTKYLNLVKKCSGKINKGELFAILGPSGGGKSTLLNCLFGKIPKGTISKGEILYDDKEREISSWIENTGFVDQDDVVNEDFTVEETLRYAALLRLNREKCFEEDKNKSFDRIVNEKVKKIVKELNLEKCFKNEMKKVSGGERKRVMIGIELIAEPEILMLDEPTSGLDSNAALSLIKLLKEMVVSQKKIVVLTIHQPSIEIFDFFDKVLFLSNGKTFYSGKVTDIDDFLLKLQIVKKKNETAPELLIKICDDKEIVNEENDYIDISNCFIQDEISIPIKKNELYIPKNLDLYKLWVLICREALTIKKRKWEFTKSQLGLVILYVILTIFSYYYETIFDMVIDKGRDVENMLVPTLSSMRTNSSFYCYKIMLMHFVILDYILTYSMIPIYILQMRITASTFMKRWKIMKREIAVGTYSIKCVYLALLIFQLVIACFMSIPYFIITFIYSRKIFGMIFIISYVLTNFISITIGLFVGAAFTKVVSAILLKTIFSFIICTRVKWIEEKLLLILSLFTSKELYFKMVSKFFLIFFILPSQQHFNLLACQIFESCKNLIQTNDGYENRQFQHAFDFLVGDDYIDYVKKYTFGLKATSINLYFIVFSTTILFSILGYCVLGLNLSPDVRMKLEKTKEITKQKAKILK